ncbi:NAD(P)-binding protein [Echria macrotheca]|uniref:NAD(P)-binding protein n=1 Tax=Echria macrotheca TaxID=438768 RepID=A0AAJ0BK01_9PEZI|nr:NAD(P)-binding protein [Echria macrotheca]
MAYRKLQDKHVLIIGGSSGIGLAVAEGCLASGANVTISSSSPARVAAAAAKLSSAFPDRTVRGAVADLSKPTVDADLDELFRSVGDIDHVVYTAADALSLGGLDSVSVEGIHAAAHMRMVVPVLVGKMAARYLPKTNLSSLVLTSGSVAERPAKGWAVTSFFAGGLVALAKALAVDLAPVRVNVVRPGYVDTGLWAHMSAEEKKAWVEGVERQMLTGKFAAVEDVAEAYLWLLKDGNATGTVAGTDSGAMLV